MSQIRQYIPFSLLLLLLLACGGTMGALLQQNTRSYDAALAATGHNYLVTQKNQDFTILVERMLASRRSYVLTGDSTLAARYNENKIGASGLLAELSVLMKDSPPQMTRLNELQFSFLNLSKKLEDMPVGSRSSLSKLAESVRTNTSSREEIIHVGQSILLEERTSLNVRLKELEVLRETTDVFIIFSGILFGGLFLLLYSYVFYTQAAQNRKKETLSVSQEIFRMASEVASDGIFEWNFRGDKAFYSRQYWALLGYFPDTFPDTIQSFKDLLHPDDKERVLAYIKKYLSGEVPEYHIIFRMKHKDGNWVWINARGRALYDDTGKPTRIVGAHTDITLVKAYEEKLEKAKEYAENANRAKTDFLAHMSHEIRTPLTAISGIAEIFDNAQNNLDDKQKKLLKVLSSSTSSLKDLVSDILDFSKIESGEIELELDQKIFGLQDVFEQVISIVSLKVGEKNFKFNFDYSAVKRHKFLGDRGRFRQILLNLIGNAVKFTEKGSVSVTATRVMHRGEASLRVDVKDTGIGIDSRHFDLIFERFKQADSSVSRRYGGSGLGLPISLRLARLMGGDITVESTLGEGSTFTLMVPLRTQEVQEDNESDKKLDKALTDKIRKQSLNHKNLLLVEDYEGNIVILSYLLDSLECNYDVARTGLEALNMWKEKRYDLILMDVQMPEMDGFTATTQIRLMEKEKDRERTPIIGMTAHALIGDKEKCIEAGMDAYLPKPLVELDLKAKIIEFLGQKKVA